MKTPEQLAKEFIARECMEHEEAAGGYYGFLAGYQAAKPQWISVKERLPEIVEPRSISDDVLWITRYGEMEVSCLERVRSGLRVDWGDAGLLKLDQFTHWMPLPEPPKEEK